MAKRFFITFFAFILLLCAVSCSAWAQMVIHSQVTTEIELRGYDTLTEVSLFKGKLPKASQYEIKNSYQGLALLVFAAGQTYPVIIGNEPFTVNITSPAEPPTFTGSSENTFLYKALAGNAQLPKQFTFGSQMIQAKQLLDSSHSIQTIAELQDKKKEFQQFVTRHFHNLKHSDMIKRLIAQYFMMHEYVDYHVAGAPATDIKKRYRKEILAGVAGWLKILSPHLSKQEIVNYCVSLYYNRSMVTLAALIADNNSDIAYCSGETAKTISFPDDLQILASAQNKTLNFSAIKGVKLIIFVSDQCPVSMVAAVSKARKMVKKKQPVTLIVAPLEKLSDKHLAMNKMIRNGNLLFISDENWYKNNLPPKVKLPLFVHVDNNFQ